MSDPEGLTPNQWSKLDAHAAVGGKRRTRNNCLWVGEEVGAKTGRSGGSIGIVEAEVVSKETVMGVEQVVDQPIDLDVSSDIVRLTVA